MSAYTSLPHGYRSVSSGTQAFQSLGHAREIILAMDDALSHLFQPTLASAQASSAIAY